MRFVDEAKIYVRSGHGGPGAVSFRREKFVPRGGPDGGDGGKGGDVIFRINPQLTTLVNFRFKRRFEAEDGGKGAQQNMTGKNGADAIVEVPAGTLIKDLNGNLICDLSGDTTEYVFLKGGRGGKGNQFFKTSVNQAPKFAQPGEPGEENEVMLELKLLADIGIIGFPNAGKSTLISRISAAKPKIADYPFTTLVPNLGVVKGPDYKSFVVADIPGLIKGAHEGAGLGISFLKHIERTRSFLHLVDVSEMASDDPVGSFEDLNFELKMYDKQHRDEQGFFPLSDRKQSVVLNKIATPYEKKRDSLKRKFEKKGYEVHMISAVTGEGLTPLLNRLIQEVSPHAH